MVSKLYSNIYVAKLWNRFNLPDVVTTEFGWRTTQLTRPMLIQRVHDWLRGDPKTRDEGLVRELRTMEYDEQGTPRARGKNKDDRVFSLGLALQGRYEQLIEPDRQPAQQGGLDHSSQRAWKHAQATLEGLRHGKRLDSGDVPGRSGGDRPRPCPKWV